MDCTTAAAEGTTTTIITITIIIVDETRPSVCVLRCIEFPTRLNSPLFHKDDSAFPVSHRSGRILSTGRRSPNNTGPTRTRPSTNTRRRHRLRPIRRRTHRRRRRRHHAAAATHDPHYPLLPPSCVQRAKPPLDHRPPVARRFCFFHATARTDTRTATHRIGIFWKVTFFPKHRSVHGPVRFRKRPSNYPALTDYLPREPSLPFTIVDCVFQRLKITPIKIDGIRHSSRYTFRYFFPL